MPVVSEILGRIMTEVWAPVAMIIFAAGFLMFIWGLVKFLWFVEDSSGREEGKQHMFWGVIGMFIMVSIWSIIALIDNTFSLGATTNGAATDPSRNQMDVRFK